MNITFGTIKRVGRDTSSNEKYPNKAVITIEGIKGEGKSRRVLFNSEAMNLLNIPVGAQQAVIFGFVESDENFQRKLLIANADSLPGKENTITYLVSKNKVSFESSKEKGKGISSSPLHGEITSFLSIDENTDNEFELSSFGEQEGLVLFELVKLSENNNDTSTSNEPENKPIDPKHLLTYSSKEDLNDAASDNDYKKENAEIDVYGSHTDIEDADKIIKSENEEFVNNTTETKEDWE